MSVAAALDAAEAAGVRLRLDGEGGVWLEAAAAPPPAVVVELRRYRNEVAALLAERARDEAAERNAIQAEASGKLGAPLPAEEHARAVLGLLRAARQRPPAWGNVASVPPVGAWCGCCGRHRPEAGGRWWREAIEPSGWRCATCHPADHLSRDDVMEVRT